MTIFADRYEIRGRLGSGGFGTVYRVMDHKLGREMALKLLSVGEEVLVVREAHVLTGLESPHILRVFNAGIYGDVPFITTEIAADGSCEDQLTTPGVGVPPRAAVRWVRHALVGLDYCHRRRVLHRDLTPGNIFLDSMDHARLGDFGIAGALDADDKAAAEGNQRIRAPECYVGDCRMDIRSEMFSAGVTLWRLLTGAWPFEGATEEDLQRGMMSGPPRLRDAAPHVHRSIAAVVEAALSPQPQERAPGATAMADALGRVAFHRRGWHPAVPTDASTAKWIGAANRGTIEVTVTPDGRRFAISTVRRPSGRRMREGCMTVTRSVLPVRLRRIFDTM